MKIVVLREYAGLPVDKPSIIVHVNPNSINYMYDVSKEGLDLTAIVFMGGHKIFVLGKLEEVTKSLLEES